MLGNILLVFVLLFLIGFLKISSMPVPGGDQGVGYGFMVILTGLGFAIFTGLLTWYMGSKGHFDWIPWSTKNGIVFLGWLAFVSSVFALAMFKVEWHEGEFPGILHTFSKWRGDIILPVMILLPVIFLLNTTRTAHEILPIVKFLMVPGFVLSIFVSLILLWGWIKFSQQQAEAKVQSNNEWNQKIHDNHLADIEAFKPGDPILNILSLTGRFHDPDVRNAAIAKVKMNPDWEAELIRLLNETEWQSNVYQFIDGNTVDNPALFVEPIKKSLLRTADEIKSRIKGANDLQDWHFEHFSLDRCLRAIDEQFSKVPGADFTNEVQQVLNALNTPKPERFKNVNFTTTKVVEAWLKQNS